MINGSGYVPSNILPASLGLAPQGDTLIGYSKSSVNEVFDPKTVLYHEITELTEQEFKDRLKSCGVNDPVVTDDGTVIDNDPPYLETRGKKYIDSMIAKAEAK